MITELRREIKKFKPFLWLVLISMVLGYASMLFIKIPSKKTIVFATVNSTPIYLHEYRQGLLQSQMRIQQLGQEMARQGLDASLALQLFGMYDPEKEAFNGLVRSKLLDGVFNALALKLDSSYVDKEIAKSIPPYFVDKATGKVNEAAYAAFLERLSLTIPEYEHARENDIKEEFASRLIRMAAYVPEYVLKAEYEKDRAKKSFAAIKLSYDDYLNKAHQEAVNSADLEKFYSDNKDDYKVAEKRAASYWVFNQDDYQKQVQIDDASIDAYYNKHKDELFRIPAEIKIRKILVAFDGKDVKAAQEKIEKLHQLVLADPQSFEKIAREHSDDKKLASKGGMTDFFARGTYDKDLELAAFRLINPGSITAPIKTKDGFEIAQLVARKKAEYKPLVAVKDDIVKSMRVKKGQALLRSELEKVKHEMRENKEAIETFARNVGAKVNSTGLVTKTEAKKITDLGMVIDKLFAGGRATEANYGFFERGLNMVFYQETSREEAHTPSLQEIRDRVVSDFRAQQAEKAIEDAAKQYKKELLLEKKTMAQLRDENKTKLIETGFVEKDGSVPGLEKASGLLKKAFELTDSKQILLYNYEKSYYIVQLTAAQGSDTPLSESLATSMRSGREMSQQSLYFEGFIASLMRNAKIERKEIAAPVGSPIDLGLD